MSDTIKERLIAYLKYKGVNNSEFGRIIGVSNAYISSIRKSIQPDKVEKISTNFPDLNMSWLIAGDGSMLKSPISQTANGDHNTQVAGNANHVNNSSTLDKALDEISQQRQLVEKSHELTANAQRQIDRLLAIIEKMQDK